MKEMSIIILAHINIIILEEIRIWKLGDIRIIVEEIIILILKKNN